MTKYTNKVVGGKYWECPDCYKPFRYRRSCLNHMVKEHNYYWWDNNDVCVGGNQIHNPTGPTKPHEYDQTTKGTTK